MKNFKKILEEGSGVWEKRYSPPDFAKDGKPFMNKAVKFIKSNWKVKGGKINGEMGGALSAEFVAKMQNKFMGKPKDVTLFLYWMEPAASVGGERFSIHLQKSGDFKEETLGENAIRNFMKKRNILPK